MARTRSGTRQLASLFAASRRPIYVLDERRRVVYCNAACAEWLGVDADQLPGAQSDYYAGEGRGDETDQAAALCPPPEVFRGESRKAWVLRRDAAGKISRRLADFLPLGDAEDDCRGVLAVLGESDEADVASPDSSDDLTAQEIHDRLRRLSTEMRGSYRLERLAGESPAIRRVREQIQLAIDGQSRVLLVGPSGSGREHVARTIHCGNDPDAAGPLMPLSCPLLDAELLQTTVLAFLRRCQESQAAQPAALLLLEIDQLSPAAQAELLAFFRVPTFTLRTIVTAHRPLLSLADEERFSRELALSLSTLVIELPGLAERRQDIPYLAQQLLEEQNARGERQLGGFTAAALDELAAMPWPENLVELAAVVQQAYKNASGPRITEEDLPPRVRIMSSAAAHPAREDETIVLDDFLGDIERELIQRALRQARGNKAGAARLLGIHRARLLRRISQLGLEETS